MPRFGTHQPSGTGTHLHIRGIGANGWDGTDEGTGVYESVEALSKLFSAYGRILDATVRHRIEGGENTSWAVVTMEDAASASRVLDAAASSPIMAGSSRLRVTLFNKHLADTSTGMMSSVRRKIHHYEDFAERVGLAPAELKRMSEAHLELLFTERKLSAISRHHISCMLQCATDEELEEAGQKIQKRHSLARENAMNTNNGTTSGEKTIQSGKRTIVYTHLHLDNLHDLDTKNQSFSVSFAIRFIWNAADAPEIYDGQNHNLMHYVAGLGNATTDWEPMWSPSFSINNINEEGERHVNAFTVFKHDTHHPKGPSEWLEAIEGDSPTVRAEHFWVVLETRQKVRVDDAMELEYFPLDQQDVTLTLFLDDEVERTQLVPLDDKSCPEGVAEMVVPEEYRNSQAVSADFLDMDTQDFHYDRKTPFSFVVVDDFEHEDEHHGAVSVNIFLDRDVEHYVWNIFLMVFSITSVTVAVWGIPPANLADRLSIDFVSLLVSQAFKLNIASELPHVTHLTYADVYILVSFIFILAAIFLHFYMAIAYGLHHSGSADARRHHDSTVLLPEDLDVQNAQTNADWIACIVWSAAYLVFNFLFYCSAKWQHNSRDAVLRSRASTGGWTIRKLDSENKRDRNAMFSRQQLRANQRKQDQQAARANVQLLQRGGFVQCSEREPGSSEYCR